MLVILIDRLIIDMSFSKKNILDLQRNPFDFMQCKVKPNLKLDRSFIVSKLWWAKFIIKSLNLCNWTNMLMQNHSLNATRFQNHLNLKITCWQINLLKDIFAKSICTCLTHPRFYPKFEQMQLKDQARWFSKINNYPQQLYLIHVRLKLALELS
jgi:hypothetical protein